ncbi:MAG: hypothetical protein V3U03_00865 [Myxococcota bacterium]
MTRAALAVVCISCIALAGCRTTEIGGPIEIPIPHNLSEQDAQNLVTRFVDRASRGGAGEASENHLRRVLAAARRPGSVARGYRGRWRVEAWEPGSVVAAYAWKRHLLRVHIEFRDRAAILRIGEGVNLRQSPTRIHKTAKALTTELAQDIRFVYGKVASGDAALVAAARSQGSAQASFCDVMWKSDAQERARCQRAQRRAYDRLRPQIDLVRAEPSTVDSRMLKACYSQAQTRAGTDWEATARCFYSYPASTR